MDKSQPSTRLRQLNSLTHSRFDQFKKTNCRYCGQLLHQPFLDLGAIPLANALLSKDNLSDPEFECPLAITHCVGCGLVQLTHVVPPDLMFAHYLYVSGTTKTFQIHFAEYAQQVRKKLLKKKGGVALDIGSNDGLLLSCYQSEGFRPVGVEPAKNLSDAANKNGLHTINCYFNEKAAKEILNQYGPVDVISGNNVFAHIDDVKSVLRNVDRLLDQKGIFVIEFPYLVTMYEKLYFDMIYHEHLSYISVLPLAFFMEANGFQIFDIQKVLSHGGSLRVFVQKNNGPYTVTETYKKILRDEQSNCYNSAAPHQKFATDVLRIKKDLLACIKKIKGEGKVIAGYGAPAKASTIINFCGLTQKDIDYIVDDNPLKQNLYVPGGKIPIVSSDYLKQKQVDYILIFAWNFASEILTKLQPSMRREKFIIPLPHPQVI